MMTEEEEQKTWSDLPNDLVVVIMDNLVIPEISDYVRCGAVCSSWQTVFLDHHRHPLPRRLQQPPLLIVPTPHISNSTTTTENKMMKMITNTKSISFYNIIHQRVYNQFQVTIPIDRHFRGSSHGWLFAVDELNACQLRLYNPFLSPSPSSEILLPSLKHLHRDPLCFNVHQCPFTYPYLRKAVLSADPSLNPTDYMVLAIYGPAERLAFYRPTTTTTTTTIGGRRGGSEDDDDGCGGEKWIFVELQSNPSDDKNSTYQFKDVIYYKGKFLPLHIFGDVVVLDPEQDMKETIRIRRPSQYHHHRRFGFDDGPSAKYLVESSGDLLLILRYIQYGESCKAIRRYPHYPLVESSGDLTLIQRYIEDDEPDMEVQIDPYSTVGFRVFKRANIDDPELKWTELKSLGDRTFFLGNSDTISIRASDYPGCKPNSIYFEDEHMPFYYYEPWNGPHDLGVFNLEDGSIENHYPTDHQTPIWPIPIWSNQVCKRGKRQHPSIHLDFSLLVLIRNHLCLSGTEEITYVVELV